jgi:glutaredoxin-related protein
MIDVKLFMEFLENSIYYPACGFDGTPIKCLSKSFSNYVYVDYLSDYKDLEYNIKFKGLLGYKVINSSLINAEELFGINWHNFILRNSEIYQKLRFECGEPFAKAYTFERQSNFSDNHGKKNITLLYIKAEGISIYKYLYIQNNITPKCLVSIVPGLAFGGNFDEYPKIFIELIKSSNKFPQYQFYDEECANNFKDIIKYYKEVAQYNNDREYYKWSTHFTLAELDVSKL